MTRAPEPLQRGPAGATTEGRATVALKARREREFEAAERALAMKPDREQARFVESLRRFRNAVFHFHEDPIPKMMEFLDDPGSEDWGYDLYGALKAFFENQLPNKEFFDSLPKRD